MAEERDLVTTFVPIRSLEDYDRGEGPSSKGQRGSRARAVPTPFQSRRRALIRLIQKQEGRETLLQLIQSITLLLYSYAPNRSKRRQMHLISESISSFRKFVLVGRWLIEASNAVQDQLHESTKGIIVRDVNGLALDRIESEDEKSSTSSSDEKGVEISAEESHKSTVNEWRHSMQDGLGSISEYLGICAETCDLMAFFGGSGMLWRVMGEKLAARQRRGLERIAMFLSFVSMIFSLLHLRYLGARQRQLLRLANHNLMRATDTVMDTGSETLLQGHLLRPEHALSNDAVSRNINKRTISDSLPPIERLLRKKEQRVLSEKKKLDHLKLERLALRSELLFNVVELVWPRYDHSKLEGYTSLIASLCHVSRLASVSRWR